MGLEVGWGFKREGTFVNLWLTHVDVWQKTAQYCKVIILQLEIKKIFKNTKESKEKDGFLLIWEENISRSFHQTSLYILLPKNCIGEHDYLPEWEEIGLTFLTSVGNRQERMIWERFLGVSQQCPMQSLSNELSGLGYG